MFKLFRKKKLEATVSRTRQIEEQIEKIREERRSLEKQIIKERVARSKNLEKKLLQKEKDDLDKADKLLRSNPIRGEDPLSDLKELSRLFSHIAGISDDGEHLREKEAMLSRAAEAASQIKVQRREAYDLSVGSDSQRKGPRRDPDEDRQYRAINKILSDMVDDIRNNRSLEMMLGINKAVNAINRYLSDIEGSEANISRAKQKSQ